LGKWNGSGHVHGRDEVRSYWKRQWASIDPHVEPIEISPNGKGKSQSKFIRWCVTSKAISLPTELVNHVFQIRNGLIQRFDIRDVDQSGKHK
jgi:hypothetical protein